MNITKNQPFSKAVTYDSALPAYAKLLFYTLERLAIWVDSPGMHYRVIRL